MCYTDFIRQNHRCFKNLMKYFLDTSALVAHTDAVGASCVYQSDPTCLICGKHLGHSGKWPAWPKMKILSSQAKIKPVYRSEKTNEVPILETVPSGGVARQVGKAVVWLMLVA